MPSLSEISLNTSGNTFVLALCFIFAIGLSYFVYRRTVPPVPTGWRILLISLRATSAILIILLLFEPILSLTRKKQDKPVVALLVDNSASMGLVDQKVDRATELKNILGANIFSKPSQDYDLELYPYSNQLHEVLESRSDSLALNGDGTDISRALGDLKEKLAERYFSSVVLVTDGADNLGENPARYAGNYGIPIYPIGVGDPAEQNDILITNYVTNEIAYAGTQIPVDVYIKSSGFQGKRVNLSLKSGTKTLDSKVITLSGNSLEQKIRLQFTPEEEGLFKYQIQLPKLEGELTDINNSKSFYVKVLKSKLKVLVIAGGPSPDLRFLKNALSVEENIEIQTAIEKPRGLFYRGMPLPSVTQMDEVDCIILMDYPRRSSTTESLERIKSILAKGKPLLLALGKNVDPEKLWSLRDFIPLKNKLAIGREQSVYISILPQGLHHPVMKLAEDDLENKENWNALPPVFSNLVSLQLDDSAQSIAGVDLERSTAGRSFPLIAIQSSGKRKSAVIFAYGIWRWDLMMWGIGETNESYRRFFRNAIRWLTTEDDSKLVRIVANKEIYRSGEQVKFTAQVYFEDYQPADGSDVAIQVKGAKETRELTLENIGGGRYDGTLQVLEGGDYEFSGTAHQQGRILGRDAGKFTVEEFSLEYQNTRMNEDLLKRIASESSGEFYASDNFSGLAEKLIFPDKYITIKNEWEIWNRIPMLITCILLLSAEWLIRKRKGML